MNKLVFICLLIFGLLSNSIAQSRPTLNDTINPSNFPVEESESMIFTKCEIPPSFPGGDNAWKKYIADNARRIDYLNCASGTYRIIVRFIVNQKGIASDVVVEYGQQRCGVENEAVRLIQSVPHWKPGIQNATIIKSYVRMEVPITIN